MDSSNDLQSISIQPAGGAVSKLIGFSLMIIILPLSFYFASKSLFFEGMLSMSSSSSYFYAAIVAIVTVHVILALFIYVAWSEGSKPSAKIE